MQFSFFEKKKRWVGEKERKNKTTTLKEIVSFYSFQSELLSQEYVHAHILSSIEWVRQNVIPYIQKWIGWRCYFQCWGGGRPNCFKRKGEKWGPSDFYDIVAICVCVKLTHSKTNVHSDNCSTLLKVFGELIWSFSSIEKKGSILLDGISAGVFAGGWTMEDISVKQLDIFGRA